MPPKKSEKKVSANKPDPEALSKDVKDFIASYQKSCNVYSVTPSASIMRVFRDSSTALANGDTADIPSFPVIIQEPLTFDGLKCLFEGLLDYRWLTRLSFWNTSFGDDGALLCAQFLSASTHCTTLELIACDLKPLCCGRMAKALACNSTLKTLILDHNPTIGNDGTALLCEGVRWNGTLSHLSFNYCDIGDEGAASVATYILRSSNVVELCLRGNKITPIGLRSLADALDKNVLLTSLDLALNPLGDNPMGIESLCGALEAHPVFMSLDLSYISILPGHVAGLLALLKANKGIVDLRISERVSTQIFDDVLIALDANKRAARRRGARGRSVKSNKSNK